MTLKCRHQTINGLTTYCTSADSPAFGTMTMQSAMTMLEPDDLLSTKV